MPLQSTTAVTAHDGGSPVGVELDVVTATDNQTAIRQSTANITVHLVDTCGRVIDLRPVVFETTSAAATASQLSSSDNVEQPGGSGNGAASENDRKEHAMIPVLTECPSRIQEDLKHIPPGKSRYIFTC
jgi:hypothetical protein